MAGRAAAAWILVVAAAACSWSKVPTTPLRGPVPSAVLVLLPRATGPSAIANPTSLAFGADRALQQRGYRALPLGVGFDLARRYGTRGPGETEDDGLRRLHFQAGVDAVLHVEVADWQTSGDRRFESARWDLTWRMCSTKGDGELWTHRSQGQWQRIDEPVSHARPVDDAPPPVEVGGTRPESFASERDLVAALHRAAMQYLPERDR